MLFEITEFLQVPYVSITSVSPLMFVTQEPHAKVLDIPLRIFEAKTRWNTAAGAYEFLIALTTKSPHVCVHTHRIE